MMNNKMGGLIVRFLLLAYLIFFGAYAFSEEPPFNNEVLKPLISHPKVIAMPHIATFTPETQYVVAKKICEELVNYE